MHHIYHEIDFARHFTGEKTALTGHSLKGRKHLWSRAVAASALSSLGHSLHSQSSAEAQAASK